jgi:hypothetical protein
MGSTLLAMLVVIWLQLFSPFAGHFLKPAHSPIFVRSPAWRDGIRLARL